MGTPEFKNIFTGLRQIITNLDINMSIPILPQLLKIFRLGKSYDHLIINYDEIKEGLKKIGSGIKEIIDSIDIKGVIEAIKSIPSVVISADLEDGVVGLITSFKKIVLIDDDGKINFPGIFGVLVNNFEDIKKIIPSL
jgi:hypothetical protein